MKIRVAIIVLVIIVATSVYRSSTEPFPYNPYEALLIASYPIFMEFSLYVLPIKGIIRLVAVWLFAIVLPPAWAGLGIILLFPEPQKIFASYDVLLPFLWIFVVMIFYVYSIALLILETIQARV